MSPFAVDAICRMGYREVEHTGIHISMEVAMALSVQLDPVLKTRVNQEAKRLGISKSAFVKDTLERVLGFKNPAELLDAVRSGTPMGDPNASENVSEKVKAKLREKHSA
jgi:hypothetical protein